MYSCFVTMVVTALHLLLLPIIIESGTATTNCDENGALRLVGGRTELEGRVEVCNSMGSWNRVCSDDWDENDAIVVCRQLGFSQVDSRAITEQDVQSSSVHTGFLFNKVYCSGLEPRLVDCSRQFQYPHVNCALTGIEDAGVNCTNLLLIRNITASFSDTSVRLMWNPVHNRVINHFEVKCFYLYNKTIHAAQSMVSSDELSIRLDGLAPFTLYNCCVSAVLDKYSSTTCIEVSTSASNNSLSTEGANGYGIAVGMLSFFNAVFIVLLILAAVALVYFVITIRKQKEELNLRNLNAKVRRLEIEKNPSYSTGNVARNDFNKYQQTMNSRRGDQVDSVKRYGEIQKTKRDSPNKKSPASLQRGCSVHDKCHAAAGQKLKSEENMEMNPSYSSVPLPGVGEYSVIGPLYEKANKKNNLSTSLKMTTGNKKDNRASPRAKSFITSSRYAHKQQRERPDDKTAQAQRLDVESNLAYSALPGSDGEYSLVGPAYHNVSKQAATDTKTKHEYAEIKETYTESRDNLQEEHSSSKTGSAYDRTGLNTDKDITSPIQRDDPKQPADIELAAVKGECDEKDDQEGEEGDNAAPSKMNKDGAVKGESYNSE